MVGRWQIDRTFIADWPGEDLGRGKRVVGFAEYRWIADKHAIQGTDRSGNGSGHFIIALDPVMKKIRMFGVHTDGSAVESVLWKKSENTFGWRFTGGGLGDGRAPAGTGEWVFSEDGRTHTETGNFTLSGEKLDPLHDVYKRLSPLNSNSP